MGFSQDIPQYDRRTYGSSAIPPRSVIVGSVGSVRREKGGVYDEGKAKRSERRGPNGQHSPSGKCLATFDANIFLIVFPRLIWALYVGGFCFHEVDT